MQLRQSFHDQVRRTEAPSSARLADPEQWWLTFTEYHNRICLTGWQMKGHLVTQGKNLIHQLKSSFAGQDALRDKVASALMVTLRKLHGEGSPPETLLEWTYRETLDTAKDVTDPAIHRQLITPWLCLVDYLQARPYYKSDVQWPVATMVPFLRAVVGSPTPETAPLLTAYALGGVNLLECGHNAVEAIKTPPDRIWRQVNATRAPALTH